MQNYRVEERTEEEEEEEEEDMLKREKGFLDDEYHDDEEDKSSIDSSVRGENGSLYSVETFTRKNQRNLKHGKGPRVKQHDAHDGNDDSGVVSSSTAANQQEEGRGGRRAVTIISARFDPDESTRFGDWGNSDRQQERENSDDLAALKSIPNSDDEAEKVAGEKKTSLHHEKSPTSSSSSSLAHSLVSATESPPLPPPPLPAATTSTQTACPRLSNAQISREETGEGSDTTSATIIINNTKPQQQQQHGRPTPLTASSLLALAESHRQGAVETAGRQQNVATGSGAANPNAGPLKQQHNAKVITTSPAAVVVKPIALFPVVPSPSCLPPQPPLLTKKSDPQPPPLTTTMISTRPLPLSIVSLPQTQKETSEVGGPQLKTTDEKSNLARQHVIPTPTSRNPLSLKTTVDTVAGGSAPIAGKGEASPTLLRRDSVGFIPTLPKSKPLLPPPLPLTAVVPLATPSSLFTPASSPFSANPGSRMNQQQQQQQSTAAEAGGGGAFSPTFSCYSAAPSSLVTAAAAPTPIPSSSATGVPVPPPPPPPPPILPLLFDTARLPRIPATDDIFTKTRIPIPIDILVEELRRRVGRVERGMFHDLHPADLNATIGGTMGGGGSHKGHRQHNSKKKGPQTREEIYAQLAVEEEKRRQIEATMGKIWRGNHSIAKIRRNFIGGAALKNALEKDAKEIEKNKLLMQQRNQRTANLTTALQPAAAGEGLPNNNNEVVNNNSSTAQRLSNNSSLKRDGSMSSIYHRKRALLNNGSNRGHRAELTLKFANLFSSKPIIQQRSSKGNSSVKFVEKYRRPSDNNNSNNQGGDVVKTAAAAATSSSTTAAMVTMAGGNNNSSASSPPTAAAVVNRERRSSILKADSRYDGGGGVGSSNNDGSPNGNANNASASASPPRRRASFFHNHNDKVHDKSNQLSTGPNGVGVVAQQQPKALLGSSAAGGGGRAGGGGGQATQYHQQQQPKLKSTLRLSSTIRGKLGSKKSASSCVSGNNNRKVSALQDDDDDSSSDEDFAGGILKLFFGNNNNNTGVKSKGGEGGGQYASSSPNSQQKSQQSKPRSGGGVKGGGTLMMNSIFSLSDWRQENESNNGKINASSSSYNESMSKTLRGAFNSNNKERGLGADWARFCHSLTVCISDYYNRNVEEIIEYWANELEENRLVMKKDLARLNTVNDPSKHTENFYQYKKTTEWANSQLNRPDERSHMEIIARLNEIILDARYTRIPRTIFEDALKTSFEINTDVSTEWSRMESAPFRDFISAQKVKEERLQALRSQGIINLRFEQCSVSDANANANNNKNASFSTMNGSGAPTSYGDARAAAVQREQERERQRQQKQKERDEAVAQRERKLSGPQKREDAKFQISVADYIFASLLPSTSPQQQPRTSPTTSKATTPAATPSTGLSPRPLQPPPIPATTAATTTKSPQQQNATVSSSSAAAAVSSSSSPSTIGKTAATVAAAAPLSSSTVGSAAPPAPAPLTPTAATVAATGKTVAAVGVGINSSSSSSFKPVSVSPSKNVSSLSTTATRKVAVAAATASTKTTTMPSTTPPLPLTSSAVVATAKTASAAVTFTSGGRGSVGVVKKSVVPLPPPSSLSPPLMPSPTPPRVTASVVANNRDDTNIKNENIAQQQLKGGGETKSKDNNNDHNHSTKNEKVDDNDVCNETFVVPYENSSFSNINNNNVQMHQQSLSNSQTPIVSRSQSPANSTSAKNSTVFDQQHQQQRRTTSSGGGVNSALIPQQQQQRKMVVSFANSRSGAQQQPLHHINGGSAPQPPHLQLASMSTTTTMSASTLIDASLLTDTSYFTNETHNANNHHLHAINRSFSQSQIEGGVSGGGGAAEDNLALLQKRRRNQKAQKMSLAKEAGRFDQHLLMYACGSHQRVLRGYFVIEKVNILLSQMWERFKSQLPNRIQQALTSDEVLLEVLRREEEEAAEERRRRRQQKEKGGNNNQHPFHPRGSVSGNSGSGGVGIGRPPLGPTAVAATSSSSPSVSPLPFSANLLSLPAVTTTTTNSFTSFSSPLMNTTTSKFGSFGSFSSFANPYQKLAADAPSSLPFYFGRDFLTLIASTNIDHDDVVNGCSTTREEKARNYMLSHALFKWLAGLSSLSATASSGKKVDDDEQQRSGSEESKEGAKGGITEEETKKGKMEMETQKKMKRPLFLAVVEFLRHLLKKIVFSLLIALRFIAVDVLLTACGGAALLQKLLVSHIFIAFFVAVLRVLGGALVIRNGIYVALFDSDENYSYFVDYDGILKSAAAEHINNNNGSSNKNNMNNNNGAFFNRNSSGRFQRSGSNTNNNSCPDNYAATAVFAKFSRRRVSASAQQRQESTSASALRGGSNNNNNLVIGNRLGGADNSKMVVKPMEKSSSLGWKIVSTVTFIGGKLLRGGVGGSGGANSNTNGVKYNLASPTSPATMSNSYNTGNKAALAQRSGSAAVGSTSNQGNNNFGLNSKSDSSFNREAQIPPLAARRNQSTTPVSPLLPPPLVPLPQQHQSNKPTTSAGDKSSGEGSVPTAVPTTIKRIDSNASDATATSLLSTNQNNNNTQKSLVLSDRSGGGGGGNDVMSPLSHTVLSIGGGKDRTSSSSAGMLLSTPITQQRTASASSKPSEGGGAEEEKGQQGQLLFSPDVKSPLPRLSDGSNDGDHRNQKRTDLFSPSPTATTANTSAPSASAAATVPWAPWHRHEANLNTTPLHAMGKGGGKHSHSRGNSVKERSGKGGGQGHGGGDASSFVKHSRNHSYGGGNNNNSKRNRGGNQTPLSPVPDYGGGAGGGGGSVVIKRVESPEAMMANSQEEDKKGEGDDTTVIVNKNNTFGSTFISRLGSAFSFASVAGRGQAQKKACERERSTLPPLATTAITPTTTTTKKRAIEFVIDGEENHSLLETRDTNVDGEITDELSASAGRNNNNIINVSDPNSNSVLIMPGDDDHSHRHRLLSPPISPTNVVIRTLSGTGVSTASSTTGGAVKGSEQTQQQQQTQSQRFASSLSPIPFLKKVRSDVSSMFNRSGNKNPTVVSAGDSLGRVSRTSSTNSKEAFNHQITKQRKQIGFLFSKKNEENDAAAAGVGSLTSPKAATPHNKNNQDSSMASSIEQKGNNCSSNNNKTTSASLLETTSAYDEQFRSRTLSEWLYRKSPSSFIQRWSYLWEPVELEETYFDSVILIHRPKPANRSKLDCSWIQMEEFTNVPISDIEGILPYKKPHVPLVLVIRFILSVGILMVLLQVTISGTFYQVSEKIEMVTSRRNMPYYDYEYYSHYSANDYGKDGSDDESTWAARKVCYNNLLELLKLLETQGQKDDEEVRAKETAGKTDEKREEMLRVRDVIYAELLRYQEEAFKSEEVEAVEEKEKDEGLLFLLEDSAVMGSDNATTNLTQKDALNGTSALVAADDDTNTSTQPQPVKPRGGNSGEEENKKSEKDMDVIAALKDEWLAFLAMRNKAKSQGKTTAAESNRDVDDNDRGNTAASSNATDDGDDSAEKDNAIEEAMTAILLEIAAKAREEEEKEKEKRRSASERSHDAMMVTEMTKTPAMEENNSDDGCVSTASSHSSCPTGDEKAPNNSTDRTFFTLLASDGDDIEAKNLSATNENHSLATANTTTTTVTSGNHSANTTTPQVTWLHMPPLALIKKNATVVILTDVVTFLTDALWTLISHSASLLWTALVMPTIAYFAPSDWTLSLLSFGGAGGDVDSFSTQINSSTPLLHNASNYSFSVAKSRKDKAAANFSAFLASLVTSTSNPIQQQRQQAVNTKKRGRDANNSQEEALRQQIMDLLISAVTASTPQSRDDNKKQQQQKARRAAAVHHHHPSPSSSHYASSSSSYDYHIRQVTPLLPVAIIAIILFQLLRTIIQFVTDINGNSANGHGLNCAHITRSRTLAEVNAMKRKQKKEAEEAEKRRLQQLREEERTAKKGGKKSAILGTITSFGKSLSATMRGGMLLALQQKRNAKNTAMYERNNNNHAAVTSSPLALMKEDSLAFPPTTIPHCTTPSASSSTLPLPSFILSLISIIRRSLQVVKEVSLYLLSTLSPVATLHVQRACSRLAASFDAMVKTFQIQYEKSTLVDGASMPLEQWTNNKRLGRNEAILTRQAASVCDQECKMILLAYFFLWQGGPTTMALLQDQVETFLKETFPVEMSMYCDEADGGVETFCFDVVSAVTKMIYMGLVTDQRYIVQHPPPPPPKTASTTASSPLAPHPSPPPPPQQQQQQPLITLTMGPQKWVQTHSVAHLASIVFREAGTDDLFEDLDGEEDEEDASSSSTSYDSDAENGNGDDDSSSGILLGSSDSDILLEDSDAEPSSSSSSASSSSDNSDEGTTSGGGKSKRGIFKRFGSIAENVDVDAASHQNDHENDFFGTSSSSSSSSSSASRPHGDISDGDRRSQNHQHRHRHSGRQQQSPLSSSTARSIANHVNNNDNNNLLASAIPRSGVASTTPPSPPPPFGVSSRSSSTSLVGQRQNLNSSNNNNKDTKEQQQINGGNDDNEERQEGDAGDGDDDDDDMGIGNVLSKFGKDFDLNDDSDTLDDEDYDDDDDNNDLGELGNQFASFIKK